MIPARMGSQRLKRKNLEKIGGYSLLELAVMKAKQVLSSSEIWVNTESDELGSVAKKLDVRYHKRPDNLADNNATSEDFIYEFLMKNECEYVVQIHSIAPLLTVGEIKKYFDHIKKYSPDILLCYEPVQIECVLGEKPVNFSFNSKTNSQDLEPVKRISWSICAWRRSSFISAYENGKCATYYGNISYFPLSSLAAHVIKTKNDIEIARKLFDYNEILGNNAV